MAIARRVSPARRNVDSRFRTRIDAYGASDCPNACADRTADNPAERPGDPVPAVITVAGASYEALGVSCQRQRYQR